MAAAGYRIWAAVVVVPHMEAAVVAHMAEAADRMAALGAAARAIISSRMSRPRTAPRAGILSRTSQSCPI
jgi:hypothetical protein